MSALTSVLPVEKLRASAIQHTSGKILEITASTRGEVYTLQFILTSPNPAALARIAQAINQEFPL